MGWPLDEDNGDEQVATVAALLSGLTESTESVCRHSKGGLCRGAADGGSGAGGSEEGRAPSLT
jgi:hypothetical protein